MLKYLMQDMARMVRYVPYGIILGGSLFFAVYLINLRRKKLGMEPGRLFATVCFYTYLGILLMITYFFRESGAETKIDLQIGSTLRINTRNNAFLIENILLFMPYGFCITWYREWKHVFFKSLLLGFITSVSIEVMQLITQRGVFQIDDILTNALGCVIGGLLFRLFQRILVMMRNYAER